MLPIAGNFSNDSRFRRINWLCRCGSREQQEHIRSHCVLYKDIRQKYEDLDNDVNLVGFFKEVLKERRRRRRRRRTGEGRRRSSRRRTTRTSLRWQAGATEEM